VIGWGTLILVVEPAHLSVGDKAFGIGIGLTAYTLGLRHAFDADHIAAIDNTTRKLMNDGQRPLSVGFFFSLGHSSVVFGLTLLIAVGLKAMIGPVEQDSSALHHYTSLIGTSVSGRVLICNRGHQRGHPGGILRVFARECAAATTTTMSSKRSWNNRGLLNRVLGRFTRSVSASWHMYPIGVLFGLGFDTATEVALLVLAGTSAAAGLPWYAILCMPVLFTAGMCLLDTIDGSFMNFAYGWAFFPPCSQGLLQHHHHRSFGGRRAAHRHRRVARLLAEQFGWTGGLWSWLDVSTSTRLVLSSSACSWSHGPRPADLALCAHRGEVDGAGRTRRLRRVEESAWVHPRSRSPPRRIRG